MFSQELMLSQEGRLAPAKLERIHPAGVNHPSGLSAIFYVCAFLPVPAKCVLKCAKTRRHASCAAFAS